MNPGQVLQPAPGLLDSSLSVSSSSSKRFSTKNKSRAHVRAVPPERPPYGRLAPPCTNRCRLPVLFDNGLYPPEPRANRLRALLQSSSLTAPAFYKVAGVSGAGVILSAVGGAMIDQARPRNVRCRLRGLHEKSATPRGHTRTSCSRPVLLFLLGAPQRRPRRSLTEPYSSLPPWTSQLPAMRAALLSVCRRSPSVATSAAGQAPPPPRPPRTVASAALVVPASPQSSCTGTSMIRMRGRPLPGRHRHRNPAIAAVRMPSARPG